MPYYGTQPHVVVSMKGTMVTTKSGKHVTTRNVSEDPVVSDPGIIKIPPLMSCDKDDAPAPMIPV